MSLEAKIEALTAAVEALTAKINGASVSAGSGKTETKTETKTEKKAEYKPKHTKEEMQALMADVRAKIGMPKAKEIRDTVGKVEKIGDITDPKVIDAVYDAAEAALAEHEKASGDGL